MFRKATHIIFSLSLLIVTAGFAVSNHSCQPASYGIGYMAGSADHCAMPDEDCQVQITSIQLESPYIETIHSISVDPITEDSSSSDLPIQWDTSVEEPGYTFSTYKLPKMQRFLARLQSYLL